MRKKTVIVRSHEPVAISKTYQQGWCDVWLSIKAKPARKKYQYAPTLISKSSFDFNVEATKRCVAKNSDLDWAEDIAHDRRVSEALANQEHYVDAEWNEIFTNRDSIDRHEAERLMALFLRLKGHVHNFKFIWKRPKIVVIPVG